MDETSEKVTKDSKRQERGKKSHKTYMKRLKKTKQKKTLEDNQLPTSPTTDGPTPSTSSSTGDPTPSTSSSTGNPTPSTPSHTTTTNDTYIYGVGILAVLAIGACVFFTYNTFQPQNKKLVDEKQDQPTSYALEKYTIND